MIEIIRSEEKYTTSFLNEEYFKAKDEFNKGVDLYFNKLKSIEKKGITPRYKKELENELIDCLIKNRKLEKEFSKINKNEKSKREKMFNLW